MGTEFPGIGVRDDCEPSCGYWKLNPINHDYGEERENRHRHPRKGVVQLTGETEALRWARPRILSQSPDAGSKDGASLPERFRRMHLYPHISFLDFWASKTERKGVSVFCVYMAIMNTCSCTCAYICVCMDMWRPEVNVGSLSPSLSILLLIFILCE